MFKSSQTSLNLNIYNYIKEINEKYIVFCYVKSEIHQKALKQKEVQINELKLSYETCLIECQKLTQINLAAKEEFEFQMKEIQNQVGLKSIIP